MTRKMTKDIKLMVEKANLQLRRYTQPEDTLARAVLQNLLDTVLLQKHMYHGFNYYEEVKVGDELVLKYAGKETTLIQYYIV